VCFCVTLDGDIISDDQIVCHILSGLRISGGDHNAHEATLQALHVQKINPGCTLRSHIRMQATPNQELMLVLQVLLLLHR
jgi:hypothetical protein